jgi:hypothetical protein
MRGVLETKNYLFQTKLQVVADYTVFTEQLRALLDRSMLSTRQ